MSHTLGVPTSSLNSFNVTIGGNKITLAQVMELTILWDIRGLAVKGTIAINDYTSFTEQKAIRGGEVVVMDMEDNDGNPCKEELIVINVSHTRNVGGDYIVLLDLLDPLSVGAIQLYPEKSWESENMVNIIDDSDTLGPLLDTKSKNFGAPPINHENFVVPLNMSFNVVIGWLMKYNNMMFFQNRDEYIMKTPADVVSDSDLGATFLYKPNNMHNSYAVSEYTAKYGNMVQSDLLQPMTKTASFDILDKQAKFTEEDYESQIDKIGGFGSEAHNFGVGENPRHAYKSDYHVIEQVDNQYQRNGFFEEEMIIMVQGRFEHQIGQEVEIDFVSKYDETSPDKNISGSWIISEITDIVIPPDFVQRITLSRTKFAE